MSQMKLSSGAIPALRCMSPLKLACSVVLGLVGASGPAVTLAQAYPNKTITMIVPYAPGGSVDGIGRVVAQKISTQMGQTVVVENRAGAGGAIGVGAVARAAADGYTLLFTSLGAMTVTVHLNKVPFDPIKDFAPVSLIATSGLVFSVHPDSPIRNMKDLIAAAKAKPGTINYSVTGVGSQTFLTGELLKRAASLEMTPIQYKGGGPAAAAVASGEVPLGITDSGPILPLSQAGKVRLIAVTGAKRASSMPDIPTVEEQGVQNFQVDTGLAMFAPAGTPASVVNRLAAEVRKAVQSPDVVERIKGMSHEPVGSSPEQLGNFVRSEFDKYGALIRETGIKSN